MQRFNPDLAAAPSGRHDPRRSGYRQVRDEAMTIFMAGFETTSLSLAWMCHLLATHPEIQARVRREAAEVLGERRPTAADYAELRYTEEW